MEELVGVVRARGRGAASDQAFLEFRLPWVAVYTRNYRRPHPFQAGSLWKQK